ncbi:MAG: CHAP domain-containing protein [Pseudonocardiaceae bacterium]
MTTTPSRGGLRLAYVDNWGYYSRYCTSWAAWALHDRNGFEMPRAIGHAANWGSWASSHGYTVNMTPAPGAVAWWNGNFGHGFGHVAWVEAVSVGVRQGTDEWLVARPLARTLSDSRAVRRLPRGAVRRRR